MTELEEDHAEKERLWRIAGIFHGYNVPFPSLRTLPSSHSLSHTHTPGMLAEFRIVLSELRIVATQLFTVTLEHARVH